MNESYLLDSLTRYIGQTVTIFTTSGGCSGSGFTGVLASVNENYVKLITNIGAAPSCPLGSSCSGYGYNYNNQNYGCGYNWLGSVTEIPICKIASFTHNAI
ncbi:LSm family protein [[Clostridium] colinum]|uniref:hypothetical protein n=1 Tax=[Clostridium] colinum TaxID=36835 RepID=UPI0020256532|nr:hypothetical protein [[Clostridium] colinum]